MASKLEYLTKRIAVVTVGPVEVGTVIYEDSTPTRNPEYVAFCPCGFVGRFDHQYKAVAALVNLADPF